MPAQAPEGDEAQAAAAEAVAGDERLALVVGPAGTGKTTALGTAARLLAGQGRPAIGLTQSGKAADVLAAETGWPAITLAKLLADHARPGVRPLPTGTAVVLDEAGMASTEDLDALVGLVERHRWRLVCVGDPAQLPAVGRGGMFGLWCERVGSHHLDAVRRFDDGWQAAASLALRRGERAAAAAYAAHGRLDTVHPALVADRVARIHEIQADAGRAVAITTASAGTARDINVAIQRRRNPRRAGPSIVLADGAQVFAGDRVATRRNDRTVTEAGHAVRNRHTWDVEAVGDDGSLVVSHPTRGRARLLAAYAAWHVELGWAVTGYGNHGDTTDHGICVVEPSSSRAGVYVGMTRGRGRNVGLVVDATGLADAEEAFAAVIARPANARAALATRDRLSGVPLESATPGPLVAQTPRQPTRGRSGSAAPISAGAAPEKRRRPIGARPNPRGRHRPARASTGAGGGRRRDRSRRPEAPAARRPPRAGTVPSALTEVPREILAATVGIPRVTIDQRRPRCRPPPPTRSSTCPPWPPAWA